MLLNMDCFGKKNLRHIDQLTTQQFLSADFNRSVHIHQTSLNFDNDSRLFGGSQGKLLMVAEGLGPKSSGHRASTVAVDAVTQYLLNAFRIADQASVEDNLFETKLKAALDHCQQILHREGEVIETHRGMAAELTAAFILWPELFLVQVGRANCCLWRDGRLTNVGRSAPTEIVGGESAELLPAFVHIKLRLGDKVLLCSHSIRDSLSDFEIGNRLSHDGTAAEICDGLGGDAIEGGCDECTTIVACFDQGTAAETKAQLAADSAERHRATPERSTAEVSVTKGIDDGADRGAMRPTEAV